MPAHFLWRYHLTETDLALVSFITHHERSTDQIQKCVLCCFPLSNRSKSNSRDTIRWPKWSLVVTCKLQHYWRNQNRRNRPLVFVQCYCFVALLQLARAFDSMAIPNLASEFTSGDWKFLGFIPLANNWNGHQRAELNLQQLMVLKLHIVTDYCC